MVSIRLVVRSAGCRLYKACHVRPVSAADLPRLKQQWLSSLLTDMTRHQVDMESLYYVGVANASLAAAALGTAPIVISMSTPAYPVTSWPFTWLWVSSVPWCSVWKGTAQDCVEHLHLRHHADSFPPWTVTCAAWTAAWGPKVSGITTDVMLFRQHSARHWYRV